MEGIHPGRQERRIRHLIPKSTADPTNRPRQLRRGLFGVRAGFALIHDQMATHRRRGGRATLRTRTIPARVGVISDTSVWACASRVYPRVCGADHPVIQLGRERVGLSPRVRGRPTAARRAGFGTGSIPACAGPTLADLGVYPGSKWFSFSLPPAGGNSFHSPVSLGPCGGVVVVVR